MRILCLNDPASGSDLEPRFRLLFKRTSSMKLCIDLFDISDEFEQFRVWYKNLGVFASDNMSLDFRLKEASEASKGILSLLGDLREDLFESISLYLRCHSLILTGIGLQLLQRDRDIDDDDDQSETSDTGAESETGLSSTDELKSRINLSAWELQNRFRNVSDIVSKLMKVAEVIRSSRAPSKADRAARYVCIDEDGVDLIAEFETRFLPCVLEHKYKVPEYLLDRLCKAIGRRRRCLLYQASHQRRLAYGGETDLIMPGSRALGPHIYGGGAFTQPTGGAGSAGSPTKVVETSVAALSGATTFRLEPKAKAPSTIASGSVAFDGSALEIPPPPNGASAKSTHFECPYCCIMVPMAKQKPRQWQKHVTADLQPFVCIEPDCPTPNVLFETRHDWVEHQKWEHALEWWCDGSKHAPMNFQTEESFVAHLSKSHGPNISAAEKRGLVKVAAHPLLEPFSCCPFCDFMPDTLPAGSVDSDTVHRSGISQKSLQDHIAHHLLRLFLLALPDRNDLPEDGPDSANELSSATRSTKLSAIDPEIQLADDDTLDDAPQEVPAPATDPAVIDSQWAALWASPQLRDSIRVTYTGLEHDENLRAIPQREQSTAPSDPEGDISGWYGV